MSNLNQSLSYLRQQPESNFLVITNLETSDRIGAAKIFLKDITDQDLDRYIKYHLGALSTDTQVWIEHRRDIGTTNRKAGETEIKSYKIMVRGAAPAPQPAPIENLPAVHQPQPIPSFLGNPAQGFGLGLPELITMNVNSLRLEDLKKAFDELKEEHREIKQEKRALEIDLRTANSSLAICEAQKEMAVMVAKNENKSFFESAAFEKMMDNAPQLLATFTGKELPTAQAALGTPEVSEGVQEVIDYIAENCNEQQAKTVGAIFHFINNPEFLGELGKLFIKYKGNE